MATRRATAQPDLHPAEGLLHACSCPYSASGTVTGLKQIQDIEGTYVAGEIGATVAGGASANSMKNDKGVVIKFDTTRGPSVHHRLQGRGYQTEVGCAQTRILRKALAVAARAAAR